MHVICTAGHVDHGKSTLVRALTGIEPDRFAEERRRGLTIDIGFAWTTIGGDTIAFVDLPGHERFIANMLAGAGAARLALFVVAADEGWMPQSTEHLAILDLLGIDGGVIAVTRTDLVDTETREMAVELVREEVQGTVLGEAPIIAVSALSGTGLEALRAALGELVGDAARMPPSAQRTRSQDRPRLWVDRSFSVAGAGTVVTGTLTGGELRGDDDVTLLPAGITVRIRGMQQLEQPVTVATPGRVALNLAGLPREAITRGDAVVRGAWVPTGVVDAQVRSLGNRPLRRRGAWHLHVGSAERLVRIEPWPDDRQATAGEIDGTGMVRLRFNPPLPLVPGDAFVLREAGARETVGGGQVLDARPEPRGRGRAATQRRLTQLRRRSEALAAADPAALAAAVVAERGVVAAADLDAEVGAAGIGDRVPGLAAVATAWGDPGALARWREEITAFLTAYHADHPLAAGAPLDRARDALARAGCPAAHVGAVLGNLVDEGVVRTEGPVVRLPEHSIVLDSEQLRTRQRVLAALDATPTTPPDVDLVMDQTGATQAFVRALEATGDLVRLNDRLVFSRSAYDGAIAGLRALFSSSGPFTTAEARERLSTTRKYIIPLLEELDRRGISRRVGDRREMR